ncbi:MAG: type II toxin-antitoxin system VapB family antitoxin [Trueperaceae bacterium]
MISIDDESFDELMRMAGTRNRTEAVNLAIKEFIRAEHVRRFYRLRGKLRHLPSNEELEGSDLERVRGLVGEES